MELYIKQNQLIPESEWKELVSALENSVEDTQESSSEVKKELLTSIENAFLKRVADLEHFGILFSGGVDSTFLAYLAKKHNCNFTCYTVGLENSSDVEWARRIAHKYDFDHNSKTLTLEELEQNLKETIKILESTEIVWASVGTVVHAALKLALEHKEKVVLTGLGTEEIFAGYQRHDDASQNPASLHKECWTGLKNMWHRDLLRDFKIASHLKVDVRTPYMDKAVLEAAMAIHPQHKLNKADKKIILREIAEEVGLEKEFAWRKKKAAQYGSSIVKGFDKLAKKAGYNTKKEYLASL